MKRVYATLRVLIAESTTTAISEYNRELAKVFHKSLMEKIVRPMRQRANQDPSVADKLNEQADEIERESLSYKWIVPLLAYAKKHRTFDFDELLSYLFSAVVYGNEVAAGMGTPVLKTLPAAMLSKHPDLDIHWIDIVKYFNYVSRGVVTDVIRIMSRIKPMDQELMEQGFGGVSLVDNSNPADDVIEDVLEEDIGQLKSFVRQKAKSPEEAKLFLMLLDAIIDNDYLTEQGKKKFIGVMRKLPHNAPNREDEDFWRSVWDKMRVHICVFFKNMFDKNDVRMPDSYRRMVCSSESMARIASRVFVAEVRAAVAAYVLGSATIRESMLSGDFLSPSAMVEELRAERRNASLVERVAKSVRS